ncbi:MAG TPA: hypothetical protein VHP14_03605 [Anaerolineales bacterium]|nr:hypothetical protein [Anaerolineales bacterium]
MSFIEDVRVGAESVEAGLGAEIDRLAAIFEAREVSRVCLVEDPPAEGDETRRFLLLGEHTLMA